MVSSKVLIEDFGNLGLSGFDVVVAGLWLNVCSQDFHRCLQKGNVYKTISKNAFNGRIKVLITLVTMFLSLGHLFVSHATNLCWLPCDL